MRGGRKPGLREEGQRGGGPSESPQPASRSLTQTLHLSLCVQQVDGPLGPQARTVKCDSNGAPTAHGTSGSLMVSAALIVSS